VKIWTIALNTFREAIRDRILYNLLFFALLIMVLSLSIGNLTLGQQSKIVQDVGLASMSIFGLLVAVFVGIQLVYKEIQRRTVYVLLAKPVARHEFVIGKYLGLVLTLVLNVAVMSLFLFAILGFVVNLAPTALHLAGILLILMELMVVTAVALFFSTFSTPMLSAMFTMGVFIIGHLSGDLRVLGAASQAFGVRELTTAIYYVLPNLENFNLKTEIVYELAVPPGRVLFALAYGFLYIGLLLLAAALVFRRRDFK
jgi:ABC-type transport system involved in multi-copper enzyme maturation permease subunit